MTAAVMGTNFQSLNIVASPIAIHSCTEKKEKKQVTFNLI